jgi:hypothetical protein
MDTALPQTSNATARRWTAWALEACWLGAIALVPLVFSPPGWFAFLDTPKVALLHLAGGVLAAVWAVDLALAAQTGGLPHPRLWPAGARGALGWLRADPLRWPLAAGLALALVSAWPRQPSPPCPARRSGATSGDATAPRSWAPPPWHWWR